MPEEKILTQEEIEEEGKVAAKDVQSVEDQAKVNVIMERFRTDRLAKQLIDEELEDAVVEYENMLSASADGLANINNPILFSVVQSKIAEELSAMPDIRFLPVKREDMGYVDSTRATYNHSTTKGGFNFEIYKCFLWKDVGGTGIGREEYVQTIRTVFDRIQKKDEEGNDIEGEYEEKPRIFYDYDDLKFSCVDPRRFYPDSRAEDQEHTRWTTEIEEADYDAWKMNIQHDDSYIKKNVDLVKPTNFYSYAYPEGMVFETEEEKKKFIESDASSNKVLLMHHFYKTGDRYQVIANGILVKDIPNPYAHKMPPYVRFVNYQELAAYWGRSDYKILKQNIEEQNFLSNNLADWSKINVNRPIMLGATEFEDEDVEFAPGAIWKLGDVNQVKMLDLGDLPNGIFGVRDTLNADIVAYTGVDPRSLTQGAEETATRSALKQEKFLKRIGMGLRLVDWTALEPFAKMRLSNIQQFYTQKRVTMLYDDDGELAVEEGGFRQIRVKDKEIIKDKDGVIRFVDRKGAVSFFDSTPEVIHAQMDVEAVTGSTLSTSKEVDRQNFNAALQSLAAYPELRAKMDWNYWGGELAKRQNLDPDKALLPEKGADEMDENASAEDMLAEQGVLPPGQVPPAPEAPPLPTEQEVPTEDLIASLGVNQPQ